MTDAHKEIFPDGKGLLGLFILSILISNKSLRILEAPAKQVTTIIVFVNIIFSCMLSVIKATTTTEIAENNKFNGRRILIYEKNVRIQWVNLG